MRARTTWNQNEILGRTAATIRTADPYAMNQDHLKQQPPADKYLTGDPSAFAEDITTPNTWDMEYSGGAVKRDEIGLPQDRPDTFNHPEKTASVNHDHLLKKADITVRIARRMLGAYALETAIEEQAASLMHLPDQEVINTYNRLANEMPPQLQKSQQEQQAAKKEQAEEEAKEQAKQAAIRGDKVGFDAALAKLARIASDPQFQQAQGQQQQQAAQDQWAQMQQQAQGQQQQQAGQQQSAWYDSNAPRPGHPGKDMGPYAGQQQAQGQHMPPAMQQQGQGQQMPPAQQQQAGLTNPQAPSPQLAQMQQAQGQQGQGVEAQVQQMIEQAAQQMQAKQANGQQHAPMQQQAQGQQGQQAPAQQQAGQQQAGWGQQQQAGQQQAGWGQQQQAGQGQQMPPSQQQAGQQQGCGPMMQQGQGQQAPMMQQSGHHMQATEDMLIDQMLMPQGAPAAAPGSVAEMDIQMEAPSMDIGDVSFQPGEDDMLRQLFSNDEAMAAQQAQQAQEQQGGQGQQVQANIRTAALRTVGTRPTAGVARIGGAGAPPGRGQEVDKLTSLWQSAPDVREAFGLKTT